MIMGVTPVRSVNVQHRHHRVAYASLAVALALTTAGCTSSSTPASKATEQSSRPSATPPASHTPQGTGLIPPEDDSPGAAVVTDQGDSLPPPDDMPPDAATLAWLDGPTPEAGIVIDHDTTQHWQGRRPGEHATLGDGWYRYFGADGSLVGCTSSGSCVGIGRDGTIAIVAHPDSVRRVYGDGGDYLGRYRADGTELASSGTAPPLAEALTDSGVDLAGLMDAATRSPSFAGGITGDPHLITMGGTRIATQISGRFIARTGDPSRTLQLEMSAMPHRDTVSVVTALAIGSGTDTVVIDASGRVSINDRIRAPSEKFEQLWLGSGVTAGLWPAGSTGDTTLVIVWPDNGSVTATARGALGLTVIAHLPDHDGIGGLFGSPGARAGSDLIARSGTSGSISQTVTSWHVRSSEQLFSNATSAPVVIPAAVATPDQDARDVGRSACRSERIRRVADVDSCAFDVAVTGDTGFIAGHVAMATAAEALPVPRAVAHRWPALVRGSVINAPTLPTDGHIDALLDAESTRAYRLTLSRGGTIGVSSPRECPTNRTPPSRGMAALRLFDAGGHPVSHRWAPCGDHTTGPLAAGDYSLVLAGPVAGPAVDAQLDVAVP